MQHLFQSSFLQSLGYAIANSFWQTALVWLIFLGATGIRRVSAAARYRLAVAAQLIGFAWFIVTFQFYYTQYNHALQNAPDAPQQMQAILTPATDFSSHLLNWMVRGEQLLPYVSMAYLLLMLFLCLRWMLGYRQTQLIRSQGLQKMPAEWRLFVNRIAEQLRIRQKIKIFLSDTVSTPLTIGFLKPVILIPVASINHLTTDQLEAVLLHELAHIKRYDYLVNIVLSVVEISLFFNPFTQLLSKSIRKERENSCDDWVLQFQYDVSVYAEALLRIAYLQARPAGLAMAATGKKNELLTRVKRMIGEKENRFNYRKQLLAFVIVTGILSSVAWLNPRVQHRNGATPAAIASNKKAAAYAVEPMAVSIDNPLFNPMFFLSKPLKDEMKKNIASAQKEIDEAMVAVGDLNEPLHAIGSITPLVADAMEMAAASLQTSTIETELSRAEMELAKKALGNSLYSDSAVFMPRMKKQINADLNASMKEMEAGLKTAKEEMLRAFKVSGDANLEKLALENDLSKVMDELTVLGKTGLGNIIVNSLSLSSGILSDIAAQARKRSKLPSKEKTKTVTPEVPPEPQAEDARLEKVNTEKKTEDKKIVI